MNRLPGAAFILFLAWSSLAADPPEIATIRAQNQQNFTRSQKILSEIRSLQAMKKQAMGDISRGELCSGCNQTRSEIEAQGDHFPHPGQHILRQSAAEIAAKQAEKAREFDDKIRTLYAELAQLDTENRSLTAQGNKLMFDAQTAAFKADQERRAQDQARSKAKYEQLQKEAKESGQKLSDTLQKSFDDAKTKNEQAQQNGQRQFQELSQQRNQFFAPSDEQRALSEQVRDLTRDIQQTKPLAPTERAEQNRLQELANAGLASGPVNAAASGVMVIADNVASVWNRVMDVKEGFADLGTAFDRVVKNELLDPAARTRLVLESAADTVKLGGAVSSQLSPAVEALLSGDTARQQKIQSRLDTATDSFAGGADRRAERISPEYNAIRSGERLRDTLDTATSPLAAPATDQERLQNYQKATGSAWDMAMSAREKPPEQPRAPILTEPKRWGPATGAGPLGAEIAQTFRSRSYTEHSAALPLTLYRVSTGKSGSYWTRTPPPAANGAVQIRVPTGTRLFEGVAPAQTGSVGGDNQIFLLTVDPAWEIK